MIEEIIVKLEGYLLKLWIRKIIHENQEVFDELAKR